MADRIEEGTTVVRVSFFWLLLSVLLMVGIGLLGGVLGSQLWPRQTTPLVTERPPVVTTTQQVTISPNRAAVELVEQTQRSVLLIAEAATPETPVATGVVLTNDGLVATHGAVPRTPLIGFDHQGSGLPLEVVGVDALYGLTYLRVRDGVLTPLALRSDGAQVAEQLLVVSRAPDGLGPRVEEYAVAQYALPGASVGAAVQRVLVGPAYADEAIMGSPLIDEDGELAGLLIDPARGHALDAATVDDSLQRVITGKREVDPWADLGIAVEFDQLGLAVGETVRLVAEITRVRTGSPAAQAGLQRGDYIVRINEEMLVWETSVTNLLSSEGPFVLGLQRAGRDVQVSLERAVPETP